MERVVVGGGWAGCAAAQAARHTDVAYPGHHHATLYDVHLIEGNVTRVLREADIDLRY